MSKLEIQKKPLYEQLQAAFLLELSTLPAYLSALFSIKPGKNGEAAEIIHSVIMEEMLHMTMAGNLMSSIGGQIELSQKTVPAYPFNLEFKGKKFKDRDFEVNLEVFGKDAIETFMKIEMPSDIAEIQAKKYTGKTQTVVPGISIGEFYAAVEKNLADLCAQYSEKKVFSGKKNIQVSENYYWAGGGKPIVITNLKKAKQAVEVVVAQGEGATSKTIFDEDHKIFGQRPDVAHYFKFAEIFYARKYKPQDHPLKPPTGKKIEIDYREVYPIKKNATSEDYKDHPELFALNTRFNKAYTLMLIQIQEGFTGHPENLYTAIINGMHSLSGIAREMVIMPIKGNSKFHGTPTFEWVDPDYLK